MAFFPKAQPEPRGCGERVPGGVYAESGLSEHGSPIEHFLIDPPRPIPPGLDLVNKPQMWQRMNAAGQPEVDESGMPIYDLLIHVGAEHYPFVPDFVEEARRLGVSRRLNSNMDLSLFSLSSRMLLAHPKAIPVSWRDLTPPEECRKHLPGHDMASYRDQALDAAHDAQRPGPCIFKLWQLIPLIPQDGGNHIPLEGQEAALRSIGSTIYPFWPSGEDVKGWGEGFILNVPLTGIALIRREDGTVNEQAKGKVLHGAQKHGEQALPFYEAEK